MIPISVFIITKNEDDRIANVINAIKKFADEIIVIDSGSTDNTTQIAQSLGAKVLFNQWRGYGPQKIFGEENCRNKWLLNIDADEEVSKELAEEIIQIFSKKINDDVAGFNIKIVNKFRFEKKPKKYAYYYNQLRLYNKDLAGFKNSAIHDSVNLKSPNKHQVLQLKNIIFHQSFRSFEHWIEKINSYSSMQAQDCYNKNKFPNYAKVFVAPILGFFKAFIIRRYFIYGFDGIIYSSLYAFSRYVKAIKSREIFYEKKFKD